MNLIDSICRWPIIKKLCFESLWWINPQATIKLASLFLSQQTCLCCLCNNWGTPIIILSFGWLSRDHLLIKTIQMLKHIYVHYEVQSSNCQWLKLNSEYLWKNWSLPFVMALQFSLISPFFFIYSLFWPLKVCRKSKAQNKVRKLSPWPRKLTLTGNLHNFIGSPPHYALRQLAGEHGPLMHLQLGVISAIMVLSLSPRKYSTLAVRYQIKTKHIISFSLVDLTNGLIFSSREPTML